MMEVQEEQKVEEEKIPNIEKELNEINFQKLFNIPNLHERKLKLSKLKAKRQMYKNYNYYEGSDV